MTPRRHRLPRIRFFVRSSTGDVAAATSYSRNIKPKICIVPTDHENTIYLSSKEAGQAYIVQRSIVNDRGMPRIKYSCACRDYLKHGRSDCKHCFCERLRRRELKVVDDSPANAPYTAATRRPPRTRFAKDGRPIRTAQREARKLMPVRVPELIALLDTSNSIGSRQTSSRGTPLTTRAITLVHKVSQGRSADAMIAEFDRLISDGMLRLRKALHQNTLTHWMSDPELTQELLKILKLTTVPFRALETAAAIDSTGLSQMRTAHYRGVRYLKDNRPGAHWIKMHAICGLESNIVLAVTITASNVHDINTYKELITSAKEYFLSNSFLQTRLIFQKTSSAGRRRTTSKQSSPLRSDGIPKQRQNTMKYARNTPTFTITDVSDSTISTGLERRSKRSSAS